MAARISTLVGRTWTLSWTHSCTSTARYSVCVCVCLCVCVCVCERERARERCRYSLKKAIGKCDEKCKLLYTHTHTHTQGVYSKYRFNQVDPNPLLGIASCRKRLKLTTEFEDEERTELDDQSKRRKAADEAFGTNPMPRLEKFTIQVSLLA